MTEEIKLVKVCSFPGCTEPYFAKDFCHHHYNVDYNARKFALDPDYHKKKTAKRLKKNPNYGWYQNLKTTWGLNERQVNAILAFQKLICALCGKPTYTSGYHKRFVMDHAHHDEIEHANIRGFVHNDCNLVIAWAEKNRGLCPPADAYLDNPPCYNDTLIHELLRLADPAKEPEPASGLIIVPPLIIPCTNALLVP